MAKKQRGVMSGNDGSVTLSEQDKISKLQNLNKVLLKQIRELREEKAALLEKNEDQMNKGQQQLAELKNEIQKLKENLQQSEREKVESSTKNAEVEAKRVVELLEVERKRAAESEENLRKQLFDKEDEINWLLSRKDELENSLGELNNRFTAYSVQEREAQSSLRSEKDDLLSRIALAQKEMEKEREMISEFQERLEKMRNENSALQSQLQECKERASATKTKRSQLQKDIAGYCTNLSKLDKEREEIRILTCKLKELKQELCSVLKNILVEEEEGALISSVSDMKSSEEDIESLNLYVQKLKVFVPNRIEESGKLHSELQTLAAQKQSMEDKYNSLKADLQRQLMVKKKFSWQTAIASTGALAAAAAAAIAYMKFSK